MGCSVCRLAPYKGSSRVWIQRHARKVLGPTKRQGPEYPAFAQSSDQLVQMESRGTHRGYSRRRWPNPSLRHPHLQRAASNERAVQEGSQLFGMASDPPLPDGIGRRSRSNPLLVTLGTRPKCPHHNTRRGTRRRNLLTVFPSTRPHPLFRIERLYRTFLVSRKASSKPRDRSLPSWRGRSHARRSRGQRKGHSIQVARLTWSRRVCRSSWSARIARSNGPRSTPSTSAQLPAQWAPRSTWTRRGVP